MNVSLKRDWELWLLDNPESQRHLTELVSLRNNSRLLRIYRSISAGAKGLSPVGGWTAPAIRAAFGPLQSIVVEIKNFGLDWREVAADFAAIRIPFDEIFEFLSLAPAAEVIFKQEHHNALMGKGLFADLRLQRLFDNVIVWDKATKLFIRPARANRFNFYDIRSDQRASHFFFAFVGYSVNIAGNLTLVA
jgi:hypothetical protein